MKKLKIIKCLAPLLGLSITLGTMTPIIASCSDNSTNNESNNGSNDNNQDSNQPGNGGDTSGPGNDSSGGNGDSGSGGGSDNPSNPDNGGNPDSGGGSGDSGSTTPPIPTIPTYKEQWLKDKQIENQNILNNLVWLYDYRDPKVLDQIINHIVGIANSSILINSGNGGKELGLYPHVKCAKNQYTPISEWSTPISSNPSLKDKIFKIGYYIPEVKVAEIPKNASTDTSYVNAYKLSTNKLSLIDSTNEFPSGDPRTNASLEYKNGDDLSKSLNLITISRPSSKSVENLLNKYQQIVTDGSSTEEPPVKQITKFLTDINSLTTGNNDQPFLVADISNKFKKFHEINNLNVNALKQVLKTENAPIFTTIQEVVNGLFNNKNNKLLTLIQDIATVLSNIKEVYSGLGSEGSSFTAINQQQEAKKICDAADTVGVILYTTMSYYFSFANDLLDLAEKCVPTINWTINFNIS